MRVIVEKETWDMLCLLAEQNGITPAPAVEMRNPPVEETPISHQELQLVARLVDAYPEAVPMDELVSYTKNCATKGDVGDPIQLPSSQVCRIRARLGDDAVETVWPMVTNRKGHLVRVYRAKAIGYRASERLVEEMRSK